MLFVPSQSSQPAAKTRPFSTLDPELMLNPEALPRASTVAMTKEYSFLRTSVPRGPKVGSLGLLAHQKERKSSRSSKIRSLADYRTEDADAGNSGASVLASDSGRGSLMQSQSSVASVVSAVSLCPEADDRLENASLTGDDVSEADGNESDSSSYSSVSAREVGGLQASTVTAREASYVVGGQEIAASSLGQFPSITDILQAAAAEQQDRAREANGVTRSPANSVCSRWVARSALVSHSILSLSMAIYMQTWCFVKTEPELLSNRLQYREAFLVSVQPPLSWPSANQGSRSREVVPATYVMAENVRLWMG